MWISEGLTTRRPLPGWGLLCLFACFQAPADAGAGKAIFEAEKCGSCHATSGPVEMIPAEERAGIKGPPLWFAGSKFKPEWLAAWLEKPTPLFRVKYGTVEEGSNEHPALSAEDAAKASAYLLSLTDAELKSGVITEKKLKRRKLFRGEKLFAKKQVCFGCHQYPSKQGDIGGFTGPTMVGAGKRLQADWIYAFMNNPLRYYPNGRMPVYGDKAHDPYTDDELKLLAQYLTNL